MSGSEIRIQQCFNVRHSGIFGFRIFNFNAEQRSGDVQTSQSVTYTQLDCVNCQFATEQVPVFAVLDSECVGTWNVISIWNDRMLLK